MLLLVLIAIHIITMVCWFAGIFYLPRLFVYHAEASDEISLERFKIMERRLYRGIMWPAGILTTVFGMAILFLNMPYYLLAGWMHAKLALVILLWGYHIWCGVYIKRFKHDSNKTSSTFFRVFNELPALLLIGIVFLVVLKP